MGSALVGGLLRAGTFRAHQIVVAEPDEDRARELAASHGVSVVAGAADAVGGADTVLLAVKPQVAAAVCGQMRSSLGDSVLVVSIVAGLGTASIEALLACPEGRRVVRTMPNTPALIGEGVAAIASGAFATDDDLDAAESLLSAVGVVVRLPESQLDAVTAVSGSGPAYLFLVAEALTDAGVALGLSREVSAILVHQTLAGAASLLTETGRNPADLRAQVTSPAGTTAAALGVLERRAVRAAFADAVRAAAERSTELGAAHTTTA